MNRVFFVHDDVIVDIGFVDITVPSCGGLDAITDVERQVREHMTAIHHWKFDDNEVKALNKGTIYVIPPDQDLIIHLVQNYQTIPVSSTSLRSKMNELIINWLGMNFILYADGGDRMSRVFTPPLHKKICALFTKVDPHVEYVMWDRHKIYLFDKEGTWVDDFNINEASMFYDVVVTHTHGIWHLARSNYKD